MPKKKTHEEFVAKLNDKFPNIKTIGEYQGNKIKIEFECLICGCNHRWFARPDNILSGYGCPECAKKKISNALSKTHEQFVEEVNKVNSNIIVVGRYNKDWNKIEFKCANSGCGNTWMATPDKIIHKKTGCPKCAKIRRAKNKTKTQEDFERDIHQSNENIEVVGAYNGSRTKALFRCSLCGNEWSAVPYSITSLGTGCPVCAQSHGEKDICLWLKNHNIYFTTQHRFIECADKSQLPFDFYLPKYNVCIEYDGEHHYKPINFGGITDEEASDNFTLTKLHDKIKTEFCSQHEINLIRIPYWEKKNIDKILSNIVNN